MAYAMITGASGGIGKELADVFAANGFDLVIIARNREALETMKKDIENRHNRKVLLIPKDLTEPDAIDSVKEILDSDHIFPDVLVNNAGFGDKAAFVDSDWDRQENMVRLNILTLMKMTYVFGKEMKQRGHGRILNLASVAAFSGGPFMSVYYASKAFVLSFSQSVNAELGPYGVTVTALCPGPTITGFEKAAGMKHSKMFSLMPQKPRDVAYAGYKACMRGQAVKYHSPVTYGFNILSRILPRSAACRLAENIDGK
jgi:short-subunit dehydrogenase